MLIYHTMSYLGHFHLG
ncbi:hypothetical protein M8C21_031376 [Ambrosia artemisiifolia]|uniref:Uncharacterized protein n=1 Tax=Ambrosia artemisiifolia TaxID=4212 RepID=A0AAD5GL94_AMBAR|nr:hypothetical protein M8C21_031376 [Ambrosia artemisiifolia]